MFLERQRKALILVGVAVVLALVLWFCWDGTVEKAPEVLAASPTVKAGPGFQSLLPANAELPSATLENPPHDPTARIIKPVEVAPEATNLLFIVVGAGGEGVSPREDYRRRMTALRRLGRNLSHDEVMVLMAFVTDGGPGRPALPKDLKVALDNEIMDLLLDQDVLPANVGDWLMALAEGNQVSAKGSGFTEGLRPDRLAELQRSAGSETTAYIAENSVLQDYAIQHLVPYVERAYVAGTSQNGAKRDGVVAAPDRQTPRLHGEEWVEFQDEYLGLTQDDTTLGATALLGLSYLAVRYEGVDREAVLSRAREVAASSAYSDPVRVTAVQVLARMGDTNSLPLIQSLATTVENPHLRESALSTEQQLAAFQPRETQAAIR